MVPERGYSELSLADGFIAYLAHRHRLSRELTNAAGSGRVPACP